MKKSLLIAGMVVVLLSMTAITTIALDEVDDDPKVPPSRPRGKSNIGHLLLVGKDADYDAIWPGTFGLLKYNLEGETFDYRFNGHGLEPNTGYSLIYYADPWPGNPGFLIASGMTNNGGSLHLKDSRNIDMDLPHDEDENYPGAKIWLVLSVDFDATNKIMTAWHPDAYLFEYDLITYDDTDWPPTTSG